MDLFWLGGDGPQDIPGWVYLHLVTTLKVPPENLVGLRCVQQVGFREGKQVTFTRIYDPHASEEAWQVKNFTSLDQHPELILYEGCWETGSDRVYLQGKGAPKPKSQ